MGPGLHRLEPEKAACLELKAIRKNRYGFDRYGSIKAGDDDRNLYKQSSDQIVKSDRLLAVAGKR